MPACERYTGALFQAGCRYAKAKNLKVMILSAKYGLLQAGDLISNYNEKLTEPYNGVWPEESGFYLGGPLYFKNAPPHLQSLLPSTMSLGKMVSEVSKLANGSKLGVVKTIAEALWEGPKSKEDLKRLLLAQFPNGHPNMLKTVDIQLRQIRIGDSQRAILRKEKDLFWLEKIASSSTLCDK